jgi:hypothetical protein
MELHSSCLLAKPAEIYPSGRSTDLPVNNARRRIPAVTFDNSVMATWRGGAHIRTRADIRCNSDSRLVEVLFIRRRLGIESCHGVHGFLASVTMRMAPWTTSCSSTTTTAIVATTSRHLSLLSNRWTVYIWLQSARITLMGLCNRRKVT